jgi:aldose sugar dehydrogenase
MVSSLARPIVLLMAAAAALVGVAACTPNSAAPSSGSAAASAPQDGEKPGRTGRGGYPLPTLPAVFDTFEYKVRASVVARGLDKPWSLLMLPDGDMLVSLRNPGQVRAIRKGVLDPTPVPGLPQMSRTFDLVLHPKFAENQWIYFGYAKAIDDKSTTMVVGRGRYDGTGFSAVDELYVSQPLGNAGGSRMAFAPDGTLYMTVGGANPMSGPRRLDTVAGKVIRLRDDGTVPADNPFVGKDGALPEIYSLGHRDHHGIAVHPATGQMFEVELGPYGGDKVNVLKAGGDYGWPDYGYGRNNDSSPLGNPTTPGIEPALLVWLPGITPSGLLFYTGDKFPTWQGNMLVGSIVRGRVNGASGVERVVFNDMLWETRRETFLSELKQRIRDIRQGPDGLIYILTEEVDGAVIKVEPAS